MMYKWVTKAQNKADFHDAAHFMVLAHADGEDIASNKQ